VAADDVAAVGLLTRAEAPSTGRIPSPATATPAVS
jgi:hypothetical protein